MINNEDQMKMLHVKSLLNHLRYFIRDEDLHIVDEFHTVCRKYCSWGPTPKASLKKDKDND